MACCSSATLMVRWCPRIALVRHAHCNKAQTALTHTCARPCTPMHIHMYIHTHTNTTNTGAWLCAADLDGETDDSDPSLSLPLHPSLAPPPKPRRPDVVTPPAHRPARSAADSAQSSVYATPQGRMPQQQQQQQQPFSQQKRVQSPQQQQQRAANGGALGNGRGRVNTSASGRMTQQEFAMAQRQRMMMQKQRMAQNQRMVCFC